MHAATELPLLTSLNYRLGTGEDQFGWLRESSDAADDPVLANQRLEADGYLYVPGFFDREAILEVRAAMTERLAAEGLLDPAYPLTEAIANPERRTAFKPDLAKDNDLLRSVVFGEQLAAFYRGIFGIDVRHFDFIWIRAIGPGPGTAPHCDLVYMGRGTRQLLTCWIPYGDVPLELGGLMVLEDSHRKSDVIANYLAQDVDSYCENRPSQVQNVKVDGHWSHPGHLSSNPVTLQQKLGGRWLTAPRFEAGDLVTFRMDLVHGSLDNQTNRIRLSSDTRYQRADEPVDERWIGVNPPGHSRAGKRGRIC